MINEAVEAPLQFPKDPEMIVQLCKPLFDRVKVPFTSFEGGAGTATVVPDKKYP